jgi:hypothetical protein
MSLLARVCLKALSIQLPPAPIGAALVFDGTRATIRFAYASSETEVLGLVVSRTVRMPLAE